MLTDYFNQDITLKVSSGVNDCNEPTYNDPVTIKGRLQFSQKLVRNKEGVEVISEATLYTLMEVKVNDVITFNDVDWIVIKSYPVPDGNGNTFYYKVML